MRIRPELCFLLFLLLLMVAAISVALTFPHFEAKLLPLLLSGAIFALAAVELGKELVSKKKTGAAVDKQAKYSTRRLGTSLAWVIGFFLGIYLLGFIVAIPIFVMAYSKSRGRSWLTAIVFAAVMVAFTYGVFEVGLQARLYRGIFFSS